MPKLEHPCNAIGTTIVCRLNDEFKKDDEHTPINYDIRYLTYMDAIIAEEVDKLWYFGITNPIYNFNFDFILPKNLTSLSLIGCKIKSLSNIILPEKLESLILTKNHIRKLPNTLPTTLLKLDISYNQIRRLWYIPINLIMLKCNNNSIHKIPDIFPNKLVDIDLSYNKLYTLPNIIPSGVNKLYIQYNSINSIPDSIINCIDLNIQYEGNDIILSDNIKNNCLTSYQSHDYSYVIINNQ
jgi:hypothetical protein